METTQNMPDPAIARPSSGHVLALSMACDGVAVLVFVALGRRSHAEGSAVAGTLSVAWPFLVGTALGWVLLLLARALGAGRAASSGRRTGAWRSVGWDVGAVVLVATVTAGMLLRHTVQDDGTPVAFIVVATVFLAVFLLGWRAVARRWGPAHWRSV